MENMTSQPKDLNIETQDNELHELYLDELADLPEYRSQFLRLFGFGIDGVDYSQDVDPRVVT